MLSSVRPRMRSYSSRCSRERISSATGSGIIPGAQVRSSRQSRPFPIACMSLAVVPCTGGGSPLGLVGAGQLVVGLAQRGVQAQGASSLGRPRGVASLESRPLRPTYAHDVILRGQPPSCRGGVEIYFLQPRVALHPAVLDVIDDEPVEILLLRQVCLE